MVTTDGHVHLFPAAWVWACSSRLGQPVQGELAVAELISRLSQMATRLSASPVILSVCLSALVQCVCVCVCVYVCVSVSILAWTCCQLTAF